MSKPVISIIVPVYNVENYIDKCINSILRQTFKNFELILVDDGSPDKCPEICDEYAKKDKRIKVIHKENGGLSSARNAGIDAATGEFIGFIDSDDFVDKDMYNTLYNIIVSNNCDIAECRIKSVTDYAYYNKENENNSNEKIILNNIEIIEAMYNNTYYGSVMVVNKLYRKNLFNNIRFPDGLIQEDVRTIYKLYYNSKNIICIDNVYYYYYQTPVSITRGKYSYKRLQAIDALEEENDFYKLKKLNIIRLKHEYLYSFCLIKNYCLLLENSYMLDEKQNQYKSKIYKKFKLNYIEFLKNKYIPFKCKILLTFFLLSPRMYDKYIYQKI